MHLYETCDEKLRTNNERRTTTVVNVNHIVKNNGPCLNLFILSIIFVVDDGILYFFLRRGVCCVCTGNRTGIFMASMAHCSWWCHCSAIAPSPDHIVSSMPGIGTGVTDPILSKIGGT